MIHDVAGCTLYITGFSNLLLFVAIYIGKYFRVIYIDSTTIKIVK